VIASVIFARDGFRHRPFLVGLLPIGAAGASEHSFVAAAAGTMLAEECPTFVGQNDMTGFTGLAPANGDRTGVRIEIMHLKLG
jgi:hypothetical protein